jgi:hypothetical protein
VIEMRDFDVAHGAPVWAITAHGPNRFSRRTDAGLQRSDLHHARERRHQRRGLER